MKSQFILGLRDALARPWRTILALILMVVALSSCALAGSWSRDTVSVLVTWARMSQWQGTFFESTAIPGTQYGFPEGELDSWLRSNLDGKHDAMSMVLWSYQSSISGDHPPVVVLLGSAAAAFRLPTAQGLYLGDQVTGIAVGQSYDTGWHMVPVLGRLPGSSYIFNLWDRLEPLINLDHCVVFVTSYTNYVDSATSSQAGGMTGPDVWGNIILLNSTYQRVESYVRAVANSTSALVLPHDLVTMDNYREGISSAIVSALIAASLVGLGFLAVCLFTGRTVRQLLYVLGVHRLVGASVGAVRLRLHVFTSLVVLLPCVVVVSLWRVAAGVSGFPWATNFVPWLPVILILVAVTQCLIVEFNLVRVRRDSLTLVSQGE